VVFFEELSSIDSAVYLATDCPVTDCVGSADEPEFVNWYNSGSGPATVYAVARAVSAWDAAATLDVSIDVAPASTGDFCSNAIDLTDETMPYDWYGSSLEDFTDGFAGLAANGCNEVTGPEVWFAVEVPAGNWLNVTDDSSTPVAIQVLTSCATNECVAASGGSIFWNNESSSAVTVYVAVEGAGVTSGPLDLTFDVIDAPPTMFGPDSYGYWGATDSDMSACADISGTGTKITGMWDDSTSSVTLGIDFGFYGTSYSSAYVSSNGVVTFGGSSASYSNTALPTSTIALPMIAAFWDDLTAEEDYSDADGIYYETYTSGGQDVFQVQFRIPPLAGGTGFYDFSVVLEETTQMIHLCYVDTTVGTSNDLGASATSGIQSGSSVGLQYSYNTSDLTEGLHIWFVAP
jgi:hypothetical protein